MAQPVPCDVCRATTADFVITEVASGDVVGVGIECLEAYTGPIIEAYKEYQAREVAELEAEAAAEILEPPPSESEPVTAKPKRGHASQSAEVEGSDEPAETTAAADVPE